MPQALTLQEFIERSKIIHDNKYDYSKSIYKNSATKVEIICPIHGPFYQKPNSHLNGRGCNLCSHNNTQHSAEMFFIRANDIHHQKYNYSLVIYKNARTKIKIICPTHGVFEQTPDSHLQGHGCSKCRDVQLSIEKRFSTPLFIEQAEALHGNKYDYSLSEYVNAKTHIKIICPTHGIFEQIPDDHLRGNGCKTCASETQMLTTEEFIERATRIHNNKYDYSKSIYTGTAEEVIIICPKHGDFLQKPKSHLLGNGCKKCATVISNLESKWLSLLEIADDEQHRQVSLRINGRLFKVDGFDPKTNTIYEFYGDYWHGNPNRYDQDDTNQSNGYTFRKLYQDTIKKENILKEAGYKIVVMWETDFRSKYLG
jgi:hypothetical protein